MYLSQVPEVDRRRMQRLPSVKNDVAVTTDITKDDEQVFIKKSFTVVSS